MWLEPLNKLNCRQTSDLIKQDPSLCASDRSPPKLCAWQPHRWACGSHCAIPGKLCSSVRGSGYTTVNCHSPNKSIGDIQKKTNLPNTSLIQNPNPLVLETFLGDGVTKGDILKTKFPQPELMLLWRLHGILNQSKPVQCFQLAVCLLLNTYVYKRPTFWKQCNMDFWWVDSWAQKFKAFLGYLLNGFTFEKGQTLQTMEEYYKLCWTGNSSLQTCEDCCKTDSFHSDLQWNRNMFQSLWTNQLAEMSS